MKYSLGLDIGVASVGWAVLDEDKKRIHDLGVRIFEQTEDPKTGESHAVKRRTARSARTRLKRRRSRLNSIKRFFTAHNLLTDDEIKKILATPSDPYNLRTKGLDQKLTNHELFICLYHIAKHRGYKSNRKIDADESKTSETGRVLQALSQNAELLADKHYRTVGEALAKDEKYAIHKRNKRDDYTNSFGRQDFTNELLAIIKKQQSLGLDLSESDVQQLIFGIDTDGAVTSQHAIMYQRPFMTSELMQKMIGACSFEPSEKRAPRGSYSFEVFRLASDLAHVVFIAKHGLKLTPERITLNAETIERIIDEVKEKPTLTYKKVRQMAGVSDDYKFTDVRGKKTDDDPEGEKNIFGAMPAYATIRKAFADAPTEWQEVNTPEALNKVALVLTIQKTDQEIKDALLAAGFSAAARDIIIGIKPTNFKTFGHLSIKALDKITPYIIQGNTYDKACELAGYDFRKKEASLDQITNPVVKRSIIQALKVVKAVQRKYGKPHYIRIETSRDLAKNFQDRKTIEREQKENQERNEGLRLELQNEYEIAAPNGVQIIKLKLYKEQHGKSLYSGESIDIHKLFSDDNAYQIDHIIPFSRSGNDGLANKALVTTKENQDKANRTPFEAYGANDEKWHQFVAQIESTYIAKSLKEGSAQDKRGNYKYNGYAFKKKANLLVQNYKNTEWNVRALNDTRYITRFIQNYLRQTVDFADRDGTQRVFTPNGTLTAYMRRRWGLAKSREQDVMHHAADAAIVASMNQKVIWRANMYAKRGEVQKYLMEAKSAEQKIDLLTGEIIEDTAPAEQAQLEKEAKEILADDHFPAPWPRFRDEVERRTKVTTTAELQNELRGFENYDDDFRLQIRPIFVSRMPNRKVKGAAHEETLRSPKATGDKNDQRTVRKPLKSVTLSALANSPVKDTDPQLYHTLRERLEQFDDKPEKAFEEPVYKKDKHGANAHQVRAIKVASTSARGVLINHGTAFAENASIAWLEIFKEIKDGKTKHFFKPVYAHQVRAGLTDIDEKWERVAKAYKNDYLRIHIGDRIEEGYYKSYDISGGTIKLLPHAAADQTSLIRVSARSATLIERFDISVLADNAPRK